MESSCSRLASSPGGTLRRLTASVAGEGGRRERSGSGLPHGRIGAGVVPRQPGGNSAPGPRVPGNIKRPAPPHPPALPCVCGCPCRCHRRVPGRLAPSGVPSIAREVPPVAAVPPGRERPDKEQDQHDEQNHSHGSLLPPGGGPCQHTHFTIALSSSSGAGLSVPTG
jgi:hypothetical protein